MVLEKEYCKWHDINTTEKFSFKILEPLQRFYPIDSLYALTA